MAIAVQATSTTGFANRDPISITKPTGTVDGDFLLAFIAWEGAATIDSVPAGWTELQSVDEPGGDSLSIYWKQASSEGASWSWGFTASQECFGGALRIDGQVPTDPTDVDNEATVTDGNSPSWANTITPTYADSLIVMAIIANQHSSEGVSAYAIATDNPTWTEQFEIYEGSIQFSLAVATAVRSAKTATGNSSATLAGTAGVDSACILFSITAITSVTVSPAVVDLTATIIEPAVTAGATVTIASPVDLTSSIQAPTITTADSKITSQDKSTASTIVNQDKS